MQTGGVFWRKRIRLYYVKQSFNNTKWSVKTNTRFSISGSSSVSGIIDFGTHGPYGVMGYPSGTILASDGIIDDIRVESTVRSAAYLLDMYKAGVNLSD